MDGHNLLKHQVSMAVPWSTFPEADTVRPIDSSTDLPHRLSHLHVATLMHNDVDHDLDRSWKKGTMTSMYILATSPPLASSCNVL